MQTHFTETQLADPDVAESNDILRTCVHCGFCTATCPTYLLLGDELDSPRGRIYLMKEMLETGAPASAQVVKHIDRCLSCLSCMTTCPSGVHYMHLVDHARAHIEQTYRRPPAERWLRGMIAAVLPYPRRFRFALLGAWFGRPLRFLLPARLAAMLALAPSRLPEGEILAGLRVFPAEGARRRRVALLAGCAQQVLAPQINAATIRLLTRLGVEVVVAEGAGCCGALVHHMGDRGASHAQAAANIRAWSREIAGEGIDAVVINASGCGTTVKDYGFMFRADPELADAAAQISALTLDVTELLDELGMTAAIDAGRRPAVTYHSACSMQHVQKLTTLPTTLLRRAGFRVKGVPEGHICCGSAGTYNIMQPALAGRLRDRKIGHIESTRPEIVATGNIGCMTQLAGGLSVPVVHTVELLDWATGGPEPAALTRA